MVGGSDRGRDVSRRDTGAGAVLRGAAAEEVDITETARPGVLRVEVERVDEAIDGLSALITTRFRLARAVRRLSESGVDTRELALVMADHDCQLRDMRAAILRVRMVPLTAVFERLPLVVRSLMKTSEKRARLEIDGGAAELDKTVAERLFPALVHLVRNAVDHGLETPEERVMAGKPEEGLLRITCETRNRQVEVRITDDGRGIDRARVGAKAGRDVSDPATLLELLCAPGLSTRAEVDTTSGRGMGMDIVRRIVVDGLGGELALDSTGPRGTGFVLRIPLTIAIVDSFTVRCGSERFVVPVPLVDEIVELEAGMVVSGPGKGDARTSSSRATDRPYRSSTWASCSPCPRRATHARRSSFAARETNRSPSRSSASWGSKRRSCDRSAIRSSNVGGVSGSTDLGDGRATLVLDLVALSSRVGGRAA